MTAGIIESIVFKFIVHIWVFPSNSFKLYCLLVCEDPAKRHKAWSQRWKALSEEDRAKYTQEAKHINDRSIEEMSTEEKVALAKRTIANMRNEVMNYLGSVKKYITHWLIHSFNEYILLPKKILSWAGLPPPRLPDHLVIIFNATELHYTD